ncbi:MULTISPECIES: hypothetical protein [Pseudomonas]|uniref:hypothetical protein n=1 Tax=Pseudomonas TaxID=286 RepID=UPI00135646F3|nr:hypothetical protein [Pseudomonas grimontii]MCS3510351.1 hypothetical protein [Pseudomonas grimontii]
MPRATRKLIVTAWKIGVTAVSFWKIVGRKNYQYQRCQWAVFPEEKRPAKKQKKKSK